MSVRLFSPEQVDQLIPTLELLLGGVYVQLAELNELRQVLERAGLPVLPEELARAPIAPDLAETVAAYTRRIQEVTGELRKVGGLGGIVKDLELGIVDFPAVWDGKEVYLCWRYGEKAVGYYHDRSSGYPGRKPLSKGRSVVSGVRPN